MPNAQHPYPCNLTLITNATSAGHTETGFENNISLNNPLSVCAIITGPRTSLRIFFQLRESSIKIDNYGGDDSDSQIGGH